MPSPRLLDSGLLARLRTASLVEGVSTLVLFFVAMPLKYLGGMPLAVRIAGTIHGVLFVALVVLLVQAIHRVPIGRALAVRGMVAAVLPFGPFLFDRSLSRVAGGAG